MTDEQKSSGLHIDSDWKTEAAREKKRLVEHERKEQAEVKTKPGIPGQPSFLDLVNILAMQAAIALGGAEGPGGEKIPPNPSVAQHQIDLLDVLLQKTEGNLTEEEKRTLSTVLYELRMQYVQATKAPPPAQENQE